MQLSSGRKVIFSCALILILLFSTASVAAQTTESAGQTKKYVAFREDDVAPYAKFAQLEAVNQLTMDKNVPVTLGIIPHPWPSPSGNQLIEVNRTFLEYMRSLTSNPLFQFAQHGYTHLDLGPSPEGPSEFYGRPYAEQYQAIKQGRDDIIQAFGVTPTSFLPPFDKSDNNTLRACEALGFTEYSTGFPDFNQNGGHLDGMQLDTIGIELGNNSLQSLENATAPWLNDPHSIDTFVVLYHPSDFSGPNGSVNPDEMKLLSDYIDYLQGTGRVQFTTLDHSSTTTGTGGAASSSAGGTPNGANSPSSAGFDSAVNDLGGTIAGLAALAVVGVVVLFSLAFILLVRFRKSKTRRL